MKCNRIPPPHTEIQSRKGDEKRGPFWAHIHPQRQAPQHTHTINVSIQLQRDTLGFTHHSRMHFLRTLRRKGLPGTEPRMGLEHLALIILITTVLNRSRIRPRLGKAHWANVNQESIEVMPHGILNLRPSHSAAPHVNSTEHTALTAGAKGIETTEAEVSTVLEVSILPCQAMEVFHTLILDTVPRIESNPPVGVRNMVLDTVLTLSLPLTVKLGHV